MPEQLIELASRVARCVGGETTVEPYARTAGWPAASIVLGSRHVLVVVAFEAYAAVWLPTGRRWTIGSSTEWPVLGAEIADAVHVYTRTSGVSLGDVIAGVAAAAAELGRGPVSVGFPWLGFASESATAASGDLGHASVGVAGASITLVQRRDCVGLAFEGAPPAASRYVGSTLELASAAGWIAETLAQRIDAATAAAVSQRAAIEAELGRPLDAAVRAVVAALREGRRFELRGSRGSREEYSWTGGRIRCSGFDEGTAYEHEVSEAELRQIVERVPSAFRLA